MESLLAIGVGLVLRVVMDIATDNDDRVGGVLVGLWEGVVLNHFVRRMPGSFDPYLGFGFRIFVDFLFTQSLSRLALVALWSLVGMLLADITPNLWRDSGLRHLYRQVCRDVRHVKRAVPRIKVKNDLPSIRLFNKSRSTSAGMSSSIRSDRASAPQSRAASPAPAPTPPRRPGRRPPGALPGSSGWSETDTSVSYQRERVVTDPGPSPSLILVREDAAYERVDATHVATSQTRITTVQNTTVTVTETQNESVLMDTIVDAAIVGATAAPTAHVPTDDLSRRDPPTIPDDWIDVNRPTFTPSNEPVAPFQPDPASTPEPQPGPSTLTPSRPPSVHPPPAIGALPDIPHVDAGGRASRLPDQIPLPESRAASVIGGVYDQPQPRGSLRDGLRTRPDKATSEIGVEPARPRAQITDTQTTKTSRSWFGSTFTRSRLTQSTDAEVPNVPLKEIQEESVGKAKSDLSAAVRSSEPQICTPAQVDPPASILTQPKDATPLLLASVVPEPEQQLGKPQEGKPVLSPANVDSTPTSVEDGKDEGSTAAPKKTSLFNLPSPSGTPPPPFTEFEGVPEGPAAGEAPAEPDPVMLDEPPTVLTTEQIVAEEKRQMFLVTQVQELETSRADLQKRIEREDDPESHLAKSLESDLEDAEKTLKAVKTRINKKIFSDTPLNPSMREIPLANKSTTEIQFIITSAIMEALLERDDAGPITIQATINKQKSLKGKAKDGKDALCVLVKRHKFKVQSETATPGIVNITF